MCGKRRASHCTRWNLQKGSDMDQQSYAMGLLVAVIVSVAWAFRRTQRLVVRRITAATLGVLAALAGYVAMVGYAIPALRDVKSSQVTLRTAVVENLFMWILCLGALVLALRFLVYAVRPPRAGVNGPANTEPGSLQSSIPH